MSQLRQKLQNFPKHTAEDLTRLKRIITERAAARPPLSDGEKERLQQEFSAVEDMGVENVFLFFYDTMYALNGCEAVFHNVMHCSYLCYFLGLTKVNPLDYRLPFERYYGRNRTHLPCCSIAVKKGAAGRVMRHLQNAYGAERIARIQDWENEYILSEKPVFTFGDIEKTVIHATEREETVWREEISSIDMATAARFQLYTFTLKETEIFEYRIFSEEEIYRKTLALFSKRPSWFWDDAYEGVKGMEKIFAATDGKFVYQEQFFEICTKCLSLTGQESDVFRRALVKRSRKETENLKVIFEEKCGEEGTSAFEYVRKRMPYVVCKAYVIGTLFLDISE
ncbi:MAG: hypothetical protein IJB97_04250 [Clostridia bacterium]|nr:hypothetical protein [Clostridia bacterium]